MSKAAYMGVGGTARKVKKMYVGVNGTARKVKKAYIGVNGTARLFYSSGLDFSNATFSETAISNIFGIPGDIGRINNRLIWSNFCDLGKDSDGDTSYSKTRVYGYSDDNGKTWIKSYLPTDHSYCWPKILSNGSHLLIFNNNSAVATSDGINWTFIPTTSLAWGSAMGGIRQVFLQNNKFIVIRSMNINSNGMYSGSPTGIGISTDGINWTNKSVGDIGLPSEYSSRSGPGAAVHFGTDGQYWYAFVESRYNADTIYRSANSDIFSQYAYLCNIPSAFDANRYRPNWCYNEDGSIAIGVGAINKTGGLQHYYYTGNYADQVHSTNTAVITRDHGITWSVITLPETITNMYYKDNTFYAISEDRNIDSEKLIWSNDVVAWHSKTITSRNVKNSNGTILDCDDYLLLGNGGIYYNTNPTITKISTS